MKKFFIPTVFTLLFFLIACNNSGNNSDSKEKKPLSVTDSLMNLVMEGHDAVMPKMGKIRGAQKKAKQMLDSLSNLPSKMQQSVADLKGKLESLVNDLSYADYSMDRWMSEFKMDSAKENIDERIKYLTEEKLKIDKVKEAILNGLARADTLLR